MCAVRNCWKTVLRDCLIAQLLRGRSDSVADRSILIPAAISWYQSLVAYQRTDSLTPPFTSARNQCGEQGHDLVRLQFCMQSGSQAFSQPHSWCKAPVADYSRTAPDKALIIRPHFPVRFEVRVPTYVSFSLVTSKHSQTNILKWIHRDTLLAEKKVSCSLSELPT